MFEAGENFLDKGDDTRAKMLKLWRQKFRVFQTSKIIYSELRHRTEKLFSQS